MTTDATPTAWDGGNRDIQKSRLSAHMLMYACRIVNSRGHVIRYYFSPMLHPVNPETRLIDVFPMLNRPLHYNSEVGRYSACRQIMPAYPISSSVSSSREADVPFFGYLPDHMPGVFYSPDGEIGDFQDKNYSITVDGRSIRMYPTGSVFFLVDA